MHPDHDLIKLPPQPSAEEILRIHGEFYREMQPTDAVKLLYQAAFGPGHMITDPSAALERTCLELESVTCQPSLPGDGTPVFEEIGGGYVRLYLNPGISPRLVTRLFAASANALSKNPVDFTGSLNLLRRLTGEGVFAFSSDELENYLTDYIRSGMPAVSHSEAYRKAYHPAYRVVRREYARLLPLLCRIEKCIEENGSCILVIDGFCASGKSTLAGFIAQAYDARLIHMDDFFLPPEKRTPERFAEPGGNVDYERFKTEVADHLADNELTYGVFDCSEMAVTSHLTLPKKSLTIIEGAYSHHLFFGDYHDLDVFVQTSPEEQLKRIRQRDGEEYLPMFVNRWIPFEKAYESAFDVRARSLYLIET
ncbi:MAG: hypothetical protein IJF78_17820 [Clostridia bacterium]|nr:hypothetical protein [Clostridia bacterium]